MPNPSSSNPPSHAGSPTAPMRRAALAAAAALPIVAAAAGPGAPDSDIAARLAARHAEANAAFMRGDMERFVRIKPIAADFTLLQPFGGPASRGWDTSPERQAERSRYFRNGKTALELVQTLTSERLVVLVMIERQRAEVGGLPEQDWSLRVTEVYRRSGAEPDAWELVHRHADPLVPGLTLVQAASLARGAGGFAHGQ